jgi:hypothetical protein
MKRDISMVLLMKGLESKEIGNGTHSGGGTLELPGDGGEIVTEIVHCVLANVNMLSQEIKLGY